VYLANWVPTNFVRVFQRGDKIGCDWKFMMVLRYPVAGFRIVLHLEFSTKPMKFAISTANTFKGKNLTTLS